MAEITADRVYETSTTTGTGSYTLAGPISGYRAFSAVCANGDTVRCYVEEVDANGVPNGGWEVGIYTWGTGGVLARTTIEASSNAGAAVSWSAGTRRIGLGVTASKLASFGAGLAFTTEALSTASPNATVNVVSLSVTSGTTNVDLALAPKGTGALTVQVADNATTGGNKRGSAALDLQTKRTASTQVASAQDSIVIGQRCTASATGAIAIGDTHTVSSPSYGSALGGFTNTVTGYNGCSIGGLRNTVDGLSAIALGGRWQSGRGITGLVTFGAAGTTVAAAGKRQGELYAFAVTTTDATPTSMGTDGASGGNDNQAILTNSSVMMISGVVMARQNATGDAKGWTFSALVKRGANAAATSIVGSPTVTVTGADSGASAWTIALTADTTNGGLAIRVTGEASKSLTWQATAMAGFCSA
ncbi:hypothetical protein A3K87_20650 [Variovorax paradoxus]|uniref:Uncharacterized protein n=1 Tax=Variovorax paradoxus TaxID=34073 RepID=A0AA91DLJ4_VARPD|nr:hypothetical protein [Variovorax paradoxus]OAK61699.1 hypothetical protein A3K87_20650 [Variovorax paradoxus]